MGANIRLLLSSLLSIATSQYQLTHYQVVLIVCMILGLTPKAIFQKQYNLVNGVRKRKTRNIVN